MKVNRSGGKKGKVKGEKIPQKKEKKDCWIDLSLSLFFLNEQQQEQEE